MNTARMLMLIGFLGLAVPGVGLMVWAKTASDAVLETPIQVDPPPRVIVEPVSVSRGEHLVRHVLDCGGCHGADFGGQMVLESALLGTFVAPNLTPGSPTGSSLSNEGWDRAIRHGVDSDGRVLVYCPAERYAALSDQDLEAVIRYLKSVEPQDREMLEIAPGPAFRLLLASGSLTLDAQRIDHEARTTAPEPGPTGEYGRHLARLAGCMDCHGADLAGRAGPPGTPAAPAIHGAALKGWREEDLSAALREGVGSDGEPLDRYMPWEAYGGLTDEEISALWRYLKYTGAAKGDG